MDCVIARILAHYKYPLTSVGNNLILNSTPFAAISSFRTKAKRNLIKYLSHWRGKGAYLPRQRGVYALTIYACIYLLFALAALFNTFETGSDTDQAVEMVRRA